MSYSLLLNERELLTIAIVISVYLFIHTRLEKGNFYVVLTDIRRGGEGGVAGRDYNIIDADCQVIVRRVSLSTS